MTEAAFNLSGAFRMSTAALREFGRLHELLLKPIIESAIDEKMTKTPTQYDKFDFESENFWIEVKSRAPPYTSESFSDWYLPVCKGLRAEQEKKRTLFFYYWAKDEKLFFIEYDRKVFDGFKTEVPHKHPDNQLHYKIPKSEWTEIEWEAKVEE